MLSLLFLASGGMKLAHWSDTAAYMSAKGMPAVPLFLAAAAAVELGGGLLLMIGVQSRLAAVVLLTYLVPVTLIFHPFWRLSGAEAQMQAVNFLKNLAIMGGMVAVAAATPAEAPALSRDPYDSGVPRPSKPSVA